MSDFIEIFLDDQYGLSTVRSPINTVVDIGANIGLFSLLARHKFPAARVHAYEPNPKILNYTAANLKAANIVLFNEGVSNEDTTGNLIWTESSRAVRTERASAGMIKLTGISTVIERIGGELDLLKLDCEGAEWEIFRKSAAFQSVRQIRMEYHLDANHGFAELKATVANLGFKINKIIPNVNFGVAWLENQKIFD
jgi:FkbM family methyltransferase